MARVADPTMRTQVIASTLAYVRGRGADPAKLIAEFALPPTAEEDAEVLVSLSTLRAFYESAERLTEDPFLGIHVASQLRRGSFGLVEFVCRSAPTVGDVLARLSRYTSLVTELVVITVTRQGDELVVEHKIPGHRECVGRHGNEFFLTMFLQQARLFTGSYLLRGRRTWFAHPAPADLSELTALFGTELQFDVGSNGIVLDASVLDMPVRTADAPLYDVLQMQAEEALARLPVADDVLRKVHEGIHGALANGAPELGHVAREMGQAPRTLQRQLHERGTSFQQEVEAIREELARKYVVDPRLPLGEVAFRLGYRDVTAFLKAFKRWTGSTPSQYRERRGAAARPPRSTPSR